MTHKEFLFKILDLLDKNEIDYMLFAGTLLGAIREHDILGSDPRDTDIAIHEKDYIKLRAVLDTAIQTTQEFVYYGMWRKEVTIIDKSNSYKVDIFLLEEHSKEIYLYSSRPDEKTNRYNHEWRCKYNKVDIFPTQCYEFLGRIVKIPANAENVIKTHYGDSWRTPDDKWTSYQPYNIDTSYAGFTPNGVFQNDIIIRNQADVNDITLIVPTYMRDDCLKRLLTTAQIYYPQMKVLVGYQGKCTLDTTFSNTEIIMLPEDCGLSYARNALVKQVETSYVLLLDDDALIDKTSDLMKMKTLFEYDDKIGIVSARMIENKIIKGYERFFLPCDDVLLLIDWNALYQKKIAEYRTYKDIRFGYAHITYNIFLAKTEVLRKYTWDNRHKVHSEHLDFFLNLHLNSDVKTVFIPDMIFGHMPVDSNPYKEKRYRQFYHLITEKYGFVKGYAIGEGTYMIYKTNERKSIQ